MDICDFASVHCLQIPINLSTIRLLLATDPPFELGSFLLKCFVASQESMVCYCFRGLNLGWHVLLMVLTDCDERPVYYLSNHFLFANLVHLLTYQLQCMVHICVVIAFYFDRSQIIGLQRHLLPYVVIVKAYVLFVLILYFFTITTEISSNTLMCFLQTHFEFRGVFG